jgi:hypothetical protein
VRFRLPHNTAENRAALVFSLPLGRGGEKAAATLAREASEKAARGERGERENYPTAKTRQRNKNRFLSDLCVCVSKQDI